MINAATSIFTHVQRANNETTYYALQLKIEFRNSLSFQRHKGIQCTILNKTTIKYLRTIKSNNNNSVIFENTIDVIIFNDSIIIFLLIKRKRAPLKKSI